jgi:histone acetyltransferase 1
MGPPAEKGWVEKWRKDLKIAGVRFIGSGTLIVSCLVAYLLSSANFIVLSRCSSSYIWTLLIHARGGRSGFKSRNGYTASTTCAVYPSLLLIFTYCDHFILQEILVQLEKEERLEKLEETFQSVREDYSRILGMIR